MPDLWAIGQASRCAGRRILTCGSKPTMGSFTQAVSLNKLSQAATSITGRFGPGISFERAIDSNSSGQRRKSRNDGRLATVVGPSRRLLAKSDFRLWGFNMTNVSNELSGGIRD